MNYSKAEEIAFDARPRRGLIATIGGSRIVSIVAMLTLYAVLVMLYDRVVAPRYSFGDFSVNPRPDTWVEIMTVFVAGLVLPADPRRMSHIFAWLSTVFLLIPAAVLSAQQGSDRHAMFMMFGGVWLVMAFCRYLSDANILFGIPTTPALARIDLPKMIALLLVVLAMLAVHVGGKLSFSLADVYDYRQDFNNSLYFPLSYLLPFAAGPLAGLIMASALHSKKYIYIVGLFVTGLLFFGFSSHKAMLFYPPFVLAIYVAITKRSGSFYLIGLFMILTLATFVAVGTVWEDLLGSSFANRLVFIPAQIHYFFFREFGDIGPQLWAESRLGLGLHRADIPLPSVNYIGLLMTGDASIGANTGWIANGYMNGGIIGIVIYAAILAMTLHVIDRLGARYGYSFIGAAFVIPIFSFVNSIDLLVGFLTGGLLLLFLVVFLLIKPEPERAVTEKTAS